MTNFTGLLQCFATILLHVVKTAGGVAQNQHQDQSSEVKYSALSSTLPFPSSTLSSSSGNDHQYEASSVCELVLPSMDSGGLIFFLHIPKVRTIFCVCLFILIPISNKRKKDDYKPKHLLPSFSSRIYIYIYIYIYIRVYVLYLSDRWNDNTPESRKS